MTNLDRIYSKSAECAVLGSLIIDPSFVPAVMAIVSDEDFFDSHHSLVYSLICTRALKSQDIDGILIRNDLEAMNKLKAPLTVQYLQDMVNSVASAASVEYYARIVKDRSIYRQLVVAHGELKEVLDSGEPISEMVEKFCETSGSVGNLSVHEDYAVVTKQLVGETILSLENNDAIIPTGFPDLDRVIGGIVCGEQIIIAARPGLGKSAFLLSCLLRMKKRTLLVSLEMTKMQIVQRILAQKAKVNMSAIACGDLTPNKEHFDCMFDVGNNTDLDWLTISGSATTFNQVQALAVRLKPEILAIDHIGLMSGPQQRKIDEVTELSRQFKTLAVRLGIPIIILSQLSRAVEGRTSKRPVLSDLRETGAIEQDADIVLMLYRDSYYTGEENDAKAEIIVQKNRRGPCRTVQLAWLGKYTSFEDLSYGN